MVHLHQLFAAVVPQGEPFDLVFEIVVPEGYVEVQVRASLTNFEPGFLLKDGTDYVLNYIPTGATVAGRKVYRALGTTAGAYDDWHEGRDPAGITTQDPVRQKALVVPVKMDRVYNFHQSTLKALKELVQAAGLQHPSDITAHHIVRRVNENDVRLLSNLLPQVRPGALLQDSTEGLHRVFTDFWAPARADRFGMGPG